MKVTKVTKVTGNPKYSLNTIKMSSGEVTHPIILVSQETENFEVPMNVAMMSQLVQQIIDVDRNDDDKQEIPLPNVKSSILAKVIEFATYYKNTEAMTEIEKVVENTANL